MYLCNVQIWLLVKAKITIQETPFLWFLINTLFLWVKVCQIVVNFKWNESTWNLKHFSFFKKYCLEIMESFCSHVNLNLTTKEIIHKSKLKFRPFLNFSFLFPPPKKKQDLKWNFLRFQVLFAKLQTFLSTNMSKIFL